MRAVVIRQYVNYCIIIVLVITAQNLIFADAKSCLVHATLIFRHGDRTPAEAYPTDPHKNYKWPRGWGELTNTGIDRLYRTGKYFQKQYRTLTTDNYEPSTVRMDSSDVDRCLMSGESFFSGYYETSKGPDVWNKWIRWFPVPVHTRPLDEDNIVSLTKPCTRYDELSKRFYETSEEVRTFCKRYQHVYEYVKEKTGLNVSAVCGQESNLLSIYTVWDTLMLERQANLTLPQWTKTVFPEPLTTFTGEGNLMQGDDPAINRFNVGPLFNVMLNEMKNITQNSSSTSTAKLRLFSGHDYVIIALLRSLRIYNNREPPFGATLIFELRLTNGKFIVSVRYQNVTGEEPHVLNSPACPNPCSFDMFQATLAPLIPRNWDAECNSQNRFNTTVTYNRRKLVRQES